MPNRPDTSQHYHQQVRSLGFGLALSHTTAPRSIILYFSGLAAMLFIIERFSKTARLAGIMLLPICNHHNIYLDGKRQRNKQ